MNNKMSETRHFSLASDAPESAAEIIHVVYQALKAKGHDPIMQMVGYNHLRRSHLHNQLQQRPFADPAVGARRDPRGIRALLYHRTRALRRHGNGTPGGFRPDGLEAVLWHAHHVAVAAEHAAEQGAELLLYAYARGVRFLDTADLYGTYPHIRRALVGCAGSCHQHQSLLLRQENRFRGPGARLPRPGPANTWTCLCCTSRNRSTRCAGIRKRWTISASRRCSAASARWA